MLVALVADAMIPQLRDYQLKAIADIYREWGSGNRFVVLVMPTGSGKSVTLSEVARREQERGQTVLILAHRQELITQLSDTLARNEVYHGIIAAARTVAHAAQLHIENYGRCFRNTINPTVFVGSVQSVKEHDIKRFAAMGSKVTVIQDEFHHATKGSKTWGRILTPLDAAGAYGLGPTATPCRTDGQGLSRETDGYGDVIVEGPTMRELIRQGNLSDYRIFCPPTDIDLALEDVSARTGDFKEAVLKAKVGTGSKIVGEIVNHYLKICPGKRGITFTVGVDTAEEVAEQYRSMGVPAVSLSGNTADAERVQAIRDLKAGKLLMIVNDSLIGEGVDIPAVEVVLFARPTQSYSLYIQMFGRALRPSEGKTHAFIIDAVGNVQRFISQGRGLPDTPQQWTLDRREKRGKSKATPGDVLKLTTCHECFAAYESSEPSCPWCGAVPAVAAARGPERIDGDLAEMPADLLARLRGERERIDESPESVKQRMLAAGAPQVVALSAAKAVRVRAESQSTLRTRIALWGAQMEAAGLSVGESQIEFKREFGIDVLSAQVLGTREATELSMRVMVGLVKMGLTVE